MVQVWSLPPNRNPSETPQELKLYFSSSRNSHYIKKPVLCPSIYTSITPKCISFKLNGIGYCYRHSLSQFFTQIGLEKGKKKTLNIHNIINRQLTARAWEGLLGVMKAEGIEWGNTMVCAFSSAHLKEDRKSVLALCLTSHLPASHPHTRMHVHTPTHTHAHTQTPFA